MKTKILTIEGMSCQHCVMELKKQLSKLELIIKDVKVGFAEIEYDDNIISDFQLADAVKEAGFQLKN